MYEILLRGIAGPERDIINARIYIDGVETASVPAQCNHMFEATISHPGNATIAVGYSFVDSASNESARHDQTVDIPPDPNRDAPAAPTEPLDVVSMTWQR